MKISFFCHFSIFKIEQLKVITELSHLYPKLVKIWFFHIMAVMVSGPELIQKVFNSDTCMEKPHIAYGLFNLDYGLLASTCKLLNT